MTQKTSISILALKAEFTKEMLGVLKNSEVAEWAGLGFSLASPTERVIHIQKVIVHYRSNPVSFSVSHTTIGRVYIAGNILVVYCNWSATLEQITGFDPETTTEIVNAITEALKTKWCPFCAHKDTVLGRCLNCWNKFM